jgi:hypothetical protein
LANDSFPAFVKLRSSATARKDASTFSSSRSLAKRSFAGGGGRFGFDYPAFAATTAVTLKLRWSGAHGLVRHTG